MPRPRILLVNPNRMRPPIAPIGLEYVAAALARSGYEPVLGDLSFAVDWRQDLTANVEEVAPNAIGVTVRNLDDAYFASQDFVLETTRDVVAHIRGLTPAPVVLGGVGFSIAPKEILAYVGAQYGIAGDGEFAFPQLLDCLASDGDPATIPGAVFHTSGNGVVTMPPDLLDLVTMPTPRRRVADNPRYFTEGGQAGVETKRGCDQSCIYCVDPIAKGRRSRLRAPVSVVEEFQDLLEQGIDVLHLCDCEFNLPPEHARAVCEALIARGLGDKIRWYTYASPKPFDTDLAKTMARAGCLGINFGVDHADPDMLRRLGRRYGLETLRPVAHACRSAGLAVMFDTLLGGPGETKESLARALEFLRNTDVDRVGLSCGVRVYPYTPLARLVRHQGPLDSNPHLHGARENNDDLLRPVFYVDAAVGDDIHAYVWQLVKGDRRFLAADPRQSDRNYNYNDNSTLANAIRAGARGAYWDILRQLPDAHADAKA
ncbi:MAG: radical SAM protein [Candidatus Hydrogenedentes bacterium]|nr:radical SAM protein [Candidatus Hydrogenedentota bacterium]